MGQREERHAYGTSLFCFSRRFYLLAVFGILAILNLVHIGNYVVSSHAVERIFGFGAQQFPGCSGLQCYEVFSCSGFRETTQHLREPLASVSGAILFPLGVVALQNMSRAQLQVMSLYLFVLTLLHGFIIVADMIFIQACDEYPMNLVYQTLLWGPAAPMTRASERALRAMDAYPASTVDGIVGGLYVEAWYLLIAGLYFVLLAYTLTQTQLLAILAERGPLGLGVHYGLDQWDETISYEALSLKMMRETGSKFVDDAKNATLATPDVEAPFGYAVGRGGYGATTRLQEVVASQFYNDEGNFVLDQIGTAPAEEDDTFVLGNIIPDEDENENDFGLDYPPAYKECEL